MNGVHCQTSTRTSATKALNGEPRTSTWLPRPQRVEDGCQRSEQRVEGEVEHQADDHRREDHRHDEQADESRRPPARVTFSAAARTRPNSSSRNTAAAVNTTVRMTAPWKLASDRSAT